MIAFANISWYLFSIAGPMTSELPSKSAVFHYHMDLQDFMLWTLFFIFLTLLLLVVLLVERIRELSGFLLRDKQKKHNQSFSDQVKRLNGQQIAKILRFKRNQHILKVLFMGLLGLSSLLLPQPLMAANSLLQAASPSVSWGKAGFIITLVLLLIPTLLAVILLFVKINKGIRRLHMGAQKEEAKQIAQEIVANEDSALEATLLARQEALAYRLAPDSLSGNHVANDPKGLLALQEGVEIPIVSRKKKAVPRPYVEPALGKLVLWYLMTACFWLLFGTTIGEYVGIKFVAPDLEHLSWLSFGRLRPVHTNAVFWGWASLAMIGLGYYVVPRVSNVPLFSIRWGWYALLLINLTVLLGTIALMAGINNGGGEYREYIWPIMLLFGIGLLLTLINFYKTIGRRTTREIYISNWYIVSAIIFTIVISIVAYVPFWQHGLGETIIQGYYMHQGVGMWFMLFTLGLVYYFLPQQLNKPIYSYSLGILAFWTQILFYTLIGSHHFVFSAIPWWLQTVAIVGSAGMAIPVIAGTTNFLMTFKGAWYKLADSYILPFFLVGTIFYFTGSMQGTAEAFRETNLIWHFTDFTVAHSHLTMYGIISFFLWACIYAIVPRLSGREAPQITIGAHFWLALLGMMMYTIPLMYGSTLKGLMWMEGKPFIDGVAFMAPYWLWRAIGGSLMWISHFFFAYNLYKMLSATKELDLGEEIIEQIEQVKS